METNTMSQQNDMLANKVIKSEAELIEVMYFKMTEVAVLSFLAFIKPSVFERNKYGH